MKCQALFSLKNGMLSSTILLGTLRVKKTVNDRKLSIINFTLCHIKVKGVS